MCGLCGIVAKKEKSSGVSIDRKILERMNECLRHRGPDAEGLWLKGPAGLAHRRLSIIDLEGGSQPMSSSDGRYHLVFNGEIYNFQEIAQELAAEGLRPKTNSDTEIILLAYARWKEACLTRFVGMFAIAIWDEKENSLFLARDRLGKKPLHYFEDEKHFIFASEIKALLAHPEVDRRLNLDALSKYLAYDYVPAPESIFQGIRKLPPGTWALLKDGQLKMQPYWQPNFTNSSQHETEADVLAQIEAKLRDAVRLRLISDVPLGVFLSGGVDSSAIVAFMAETLPAKQIKTFSIGFEEESFDERRYARQVAEYFSTDHHEEVLSPSKALELVPQIPEILDEPMADPSILPTYLLSKFTRQHVTVALGGDGGDEVFVGYENYRAAKYAPLYLRLPKLLRRTVLESLIKQISTSERNLPLDYKMKRFVRGIDFPPPVHNYVWLGSMTPSEQREIFRDDINQRRSVHSLEEMYAEALTAHKEHQPHETLQGLLASDLRLYLQDDILVKVDRASMANSLEVRAPFLDHRLVDYLLSLPLSRKFPGHQLKYLLKKVMKNKLPPAIVRRKKKGFGIPVSRWINNDLAKLFDEYLSSQRLRKAGIFKPEVVKRLLREHRTGRIDHRKVLWALLVFELWREKYNPTI